MDKMTPSCYIMSSANNSLVADLIIENVKEKIDVEKRPRIKDIVELLRQECIAVRHAQIEKDVLSEYSFVLEKLHASPDSLVDDAKADVEAYEYPAIHFIVLGFDDPDQPHLWQVTERGTALPFDDIGFVTIGSGGQLAFLDITKYEYSVEGTLSTALARIYFAKKLSERAEGVGRKTDLKVLYMQKFDENTKEPIFYTADLSDHEIIKSLDKALMAIQKYEGKQITKISDLIDEKLTGKKRTSNKEDNTV